MSGRDYGKPYNDELRSLMEAHGLGYVEVAVLLDVSKHTVHAWLRPPFNRAHMKCPRIRFETLRIILSPRETYTKAEIVEILKGA
jgi:hypothetical protein